jgi:hypothetical protein
MKKIFIVGSGAGLRIAEMQRYLDSIGKSQVEIITVNSIHDVESGGVAFDVRSIREQLNDAPSLVHELEMSPDIDPIYFEPINKKRKSWEKPYKYHR